MKREILIAAAAALLATGGLAYGQQASGDGLMGARRVMTELGISDASATKVSGKAEVKKETTWQKDVRELAAKVDGLAPKEAAERWVELYDRMMGMSKEEVEAGEYGEMGFETLCRALPRPEAWGELEKLARGRPMEEGQAGMKNLVLLLTAQILVNDGAGQDATLKRMERAVNMTERDAIVFALRGAREAWQNRQKCDALTMFEGVVERGTGGFGMDVPRLAEAGDQDRARRAMLEAIKGFGLYSTGRSGPATQKMASDLAMANLGVMRKPQWGLVSRVEDVELFEAMEGKFAKKTEKPVTVREWVDRYGGEKHFLFSAVDVYLAGLVTRGEAGKAVAFIQDHPAEVVNPWDGESFWGSDSYGTVSERRGVLEKSTTVEQAYDFFDRLTSARPEYPVWRRFWAAGNSVKKQGQVIKKLRGAIGDGKPTALERAMLERQLAGILLDEGQVEEGVALTLKTAYAPVEEGAEKKATRTNYDALEGAFKSARIGGDAKLRESTLAAVWAAIEKAPVRDHTDEILKALVEHWLENKQAGEAEKRLKVLLERYCRGMKEDKGHFGGWEYDGSKDRSANVVELLARVYHHAGRHADVLELMNHAPLWGQKDVGLFLKVEAMDDWRARPSLSVIAATALARTGRVDEARRILHDVLDAEPSSDGAYALLVEIEGERAVAKLDALFARERYEPRPVIYKAQVRLKEKKLDEAEQLARQGTAMSGLGSSKRAYGVLRDVMLAKGNPAEAGRLDSVLKALEHAEKAESDRRAGLTKQAIRGYEQALAAWDDAWWVRMRLWDAMVEIGHGGETGDLARRGFEGFAARVKPGESFYEQIFSTALLLGPAKTISDEVTAEMLRKAKDDPKAHYAVNLLRIFQWRWKESQAAIKECVRLNRDFLCAWQDAYLSVDQSLEDPEFIQAAAENILRLDQTGRYGQPELERVGNLKAIWAAVEMYPREGKKENLIYPLKQRRANATVMRLPDETSVRAVLLKRTGLADLRELTGAVRGY